MADTIDEEMQSDLEQTLEIHHDALILDVCEKMDFATAGLAKACHFHLFFTKGATVEVVGSLQLKMRFPTEEYFVETAIVELAEKFDIDLALDCHHNPDWDTLDRKWAYPRVTCTKCGSVASLGALDMKWCSPPQEINDGSD